MLQGFTAVQYASALQSAASGNLPGALPTSGIPGQHLSFERLSVPAGQREQPLSAGKCLAASRCHTTNTNAECLPGAPWQTGQDGQPCHHERMQVVLAGQQEQKTQIAEQIAEQICIADAGLNLQSLLEPYQP